MMKNRLIKAIEAGDKKHPYYEEANRYIERFESSVYKKDGVVYWHNNHQVPPEEILELWEYVGLDFDYKKSFKVLEQQIKDLILEYYEKTKDYKHSPEELAEMQAAFGEGAVVVDVITGKKVFL